MHIFTQSQIDEMYDDWLHSIEDEVDIAHRYGFRHATTMRKFLEANGKPTVNVKTATCPICGETFVPKSTTAKILLIGMPAVFLQYVCERIPRRTAGRAGKAHQRAVYRILEDCIDLHRSKGRRLELRAVCGEI